MDGTSHLARAVAPAMVPCFCCAALVALCGRAGYNGGVVFLWAMGSGQWTVASGHVQRRSRRQIVGLGLAAVLRGERTGHGVGDESARVELD